MFSKKEMGGTMQKSFMKQMMDLLLKFVGYNILARNLFQIMKRKGCLAKRQPGNLFEKENR